MFVAFAGLRSEVGSLTVPCARAYAPVSRTIGNMTSPVVVNDAWPVNSTEPPERDAAGDLRHNAKET
jgi:hypothetical protein